MILVHVAAGGNSRSVAYRHSISEALGPHSYRYHGFDPPTCARPLITGQCTHPTRLIPASYGSLPPNAPPASTPRPRSSDSSQFHSPQKHAIFTQKNAKKHLKNAAFFTVCRRHYPHLPQKRRLLYGPSARKNLLAKIRWPLSQRLAHKWGVLHVVVFQRSEIRRQWEVGSG